MTSCRRPTGVSKSPMGDCSILSELRHKAIIQTLALTADGMGGGSEAWTTFATIWCRIEPRLGNERYFGQRLEENITHVITARYLAGATATMRVSFDSRLFQIKSIISPYENKEYSVFLCVEGVGT